MRDELRSTIMFYGLTPEQEDFIMKKVSNCEFKIAGCGTDLIAIPADLLLVNPDELDDYEKKALAVYYKEVEPSEVALILTKESDIFNGIKKVFVEEDIFLEHGNADIILLKNLHQTKKDYDFSRRLANIIRLQNLIIKYPGITTKELATLEEFSERTIRRNIDTINMAGALIEHRKLDNAPHGNAKGWFSTIAIWEVL